MRVTAISKKEGEDGDTLEIGALRQENALLRGRIAQLEKDLSEVISREAALEVERERSALLHVEL